MMGDVQAYSPTYRALMKLNVQRLLLSIQVKNLNKEETIDLMNGSPEEKLCLRS